MPNENEPAGGRPDGAEEPPRAGPRPAAPAGPGVAFVLALVAAVAIALLFGLRLDPGREPTSLVGAAPREEVDGSATGEELALGRAVAALRVRDEAGDVVPVRPTGEPAVVMVSSVTCGYCERSLRDFAAMAGGRALPRLRVVTLEGAEKGAAMLRRMGVQGAWSGGPAGSAEQLLLTFRIPGTPVFAVLDSAGRVTRVVPGYPGRAGLEPLFEVMVTD